MTPRSLWNSPFFESHHRDFAKELATWSIAEEETESADLATASRSLALEMAERRLLDIVLPPDAQRGVGRIDLRLVCLAREVLAYKNMLADAVFIMQGIGTASLWLYGSDALRDRYLPPVRAGKAIAAFALSEPNAGSDVAALTTTAVRDGNCYVLNGDKTWISNAPFADHYVVVARTGEAPGSRGLTAFMVDAGTPGLTCGPAIEFGAPHAAGSLHFDECRISSDCMVGAPGQGFKVAMTTFDLFRASVGAAGIGLAHRALDETLNHVKTRRMFGKTMAEIDGVQTKLADMVVDVETAALTVYRAAWAKDVIGGRCSREVSMAKLVGSESAQRVIDAAVQMFGGAGVARGSIVEKLYREVRPIRIYEGASEVQKLVIARDLVATAPIKTS
jgi:acyl-CoA dehydrogenase